MEATPSTSSSTGHGSSLSCLAPDIHKRGLDDVSTLPVKKMKQERNPIVIDQVVNEPNEPENILNDDDDLGYVNDSDGDESDVLFDTLEPDAPLESSGIPGNLEKFISYFLHHPIKRHPGKFPRFENEMYKKLKQIGSTFTFKTVTQYQSVYLAYILSELVRTVGDRIEFWPIDWYDVEKIGTHYILMKEEFGNDIDFKLSKIETAEKLVKESSTMGDMVMIKMKTESYVKGKGAIFLEPPFIGIVLGTQKRDPQPETYTIEKTVLEEASKNSPNSFLCEENIIRTMHHTSLYDRSDYHMGIHKINNIMPLILQAKALYSLDEYEFKNHILSPIMTIKTSGVGIDDSLVSDRDHVDTFQKVNDLVGLNDQNSSSFLGIEYDREDFEIIVVPIVRQLMNKFSVFKLKDENIAILITSRESRYVENVCRYLSEFMDGPNDAIVFPSKKFDETTDKMLIELYQSHIVSSENVTELQRKGNERYSKCIDYLKSERSIDDLSPHWVAEIIRGRNEIKKKLLKEAKVICSVYEQLCQDITFLNTFNPKTTSEQRLLCCICIEAQYISELKVLSLINFGVSKFILIGKTSDNKKSYACESPPLILRLFGFYLKDQMPVNSSYVKW